MSDEKKNNTRYNMFKRSNGPPIFKEDDKLLIVDQLKRLVIDLMCKNKIGETYFKNQCDEHLRKQGVRNGRVRSGRIYNFVDMLKKDKRVTFKKLIELLNTLDFELEEVSIKVKVDGEIQEYTVR